MSKYLILCYFYKREIRPVQDISGFIPPARAFHDSALVGNNLIIYGGILQNNRVSNDFFVYNLLKQEFTHVTNKCKSACKIIFKP